MKPNELRLGNFVMKGKNQHRIFSIDVWGQLSFDAIKRKPNGNAAECEGIPLTAEWLERFPVYMIPPKGLKYGFQQAIYWIEFSGENLGWRMMDREHHWIGCEYIKYVHQLQNLYFALTGSELELKQSVTP